MSRSRDADAPHGDTRNAKRTWAVVRFNVQPSTQRKRSERSSDLFDGSSTMHESRIANVPSYRQKRGTNTRSQCRRVPKSCLLRYRRHLLSCARST